MLENTLTVGRISEGFVLDTLKPAKHGDAIKYLHLDKIRTAALPSSKNAKSNKMGKKRYHED